MTAVIRLFPLAPSAIKLPVYKNVRLLQDATGRPCHLDKPAGGGRDTLPAGRMTKGGNMPAVFRLFSSLLVGAVVVAGTSLATAQDYPNRPVRLIVPNTAGTLTDGIARVM